MIVFGQVSLLMAFVASGYAAFVGMASGRHRRPGIARSGVWAAAVAVASLTAATGLLAYALLAKDFTFQYVAQYSGASLPWYYALSAFWVGQAGSLLLWAWLLGLVATVFRFWPRRNEGTFPAAAESCPRQAWAWHPSFLSCAAYILPFLRHYTSGNSRHDDSEGAIRPLRETAFGILMACLCVLAAILVFAADPMEPSLAAHRGDGLIPSLQHPAMLIHPPIVFLGYALWAVPFALAIAALAAGRPGADWVRLARPWALFAWVVLGIGILLGGHWAYEELGWGGYWNWDPVENASLLPWLTGTALVHCLLAWQRLGVLKKTTCLLTIATFGLCNFAAFLTRSGVFSSLHAFSQSPIGWTFLALVAALVAGGGLLVALRRTHLLPDRAIHSLASREALILLTTLALAALAMAIFLGTVSVPLSETITGRKIVVGAAYYNGVLIPVGLLLLAATAAAPLLRWGSLPSPRQLRVLFCAAGAGAIGPAGAWLLGLRGPLPLAVAWLAAAAVAGLIGSVVLDGLALRPGNPLLRLAQTLAGNRRRYAGWLMHLGLLSLAMGVAGSALGTHRCDVVLREGESTTWAGRTVRYARLIQHQSPERFVVEAELEISSSGGDTYRLRPAQQLYRSQNEWASRVAIHSGWASDFYTILRGNRGPEGVRLTLVENPMMRWLWASGWIVLAGMLVRLWPVRRRPAPPSHPAARQPASRRAAPVRRRVHA